MTYFRYDDNKRGFDMAGIEWEIGEPKSIALHNHGGSYISIIENPVDERYQTQVTRSGKVIAVLNEQDTARFIQELTGHNKPGLPRSIKSTIETIEHFLSSGDRV